MHIKEMDDGELRNELQVLKNEMMTTEKMYEKMELEKDRSYEILRSFGPKYLDSKTVDLKAWRPENPTYGYCHRMTGMVFRKFEHQKDIGVMKIHTLDCYHFFLILRENERNYLIDLTRDQSNNVYPYEKGKIVHSSTLTNFRKNQSKGKLNNFIRNFFEQYNE